MDFFRDIVLVAAAQSGGAAGSPPPQYAAWPALIGAELMVNGNCSSATGWTLGTGITIALGKMTAAGATDFCYNDGPVDAVLINGVTYRCSFKINSVSLGSAQIFIGGDGPIHSTTGTFTDDIVHAGSGDWILGLTDATMQLDDFSVKSLGAMGVEEDWDFTASEVSWSAFDATVAFDGANNSSIAALTGAAKTSFDAVVSNSTACTVTISVLGYAGTGGLDVRMKEGSWTNVPANLDGNFPVSVTSGTGSGFDMRGESGSAATFRVSRVQVTLA